MQSNIGLVHNARACSLPSTSRCRKAIGPQHRQQHRQQHRRHGNVAIHCSATESRRSLLAGLSFAFVLVSNTCLEGAAAAAAVPLPKGYENVSSKLVQALREAIETDLSDASERVVRRKAEGAKTLVKQWLADWRDSPLVTQDPSHIQIQATIQELGQFYMKNGQRARLPSSMGQDLLHRLDAAAIALPLP